MLFPLKHVALLAVALMGSSATAQPAQKPRVFREVNVTADSAQGWLPSEDLERRVRQAVDRYFAAIDSGSYRRAYDMMSEGNKAMLSYEQFKRQGEQFRAQAGPLRRRDVLKITWTKDPANAPFPGVYAAVDAAASFKGVDRQCGYIVMFEQPGGKDLEVMRIENNYIDNMTAANIARTQSVAELNRMWAALSANCPNFVSGKPAVAQTGKVPLPEAPESTLGYASVASALKALRAKANVAFTNENGWTIATDEAAYTIWSFAPPDYPAYPAVVKRQVVSRADGSSLQMSVHCEASKLACDNLVRTFSQQNGMPLPK